MSLQFSVEMNEQAKNVRIIFRGDAVQIGKMISHAIDARPEIAACVITAVGAWMNEKGIPLSSFEKMVTGKLNT